MSDVKQRRSGALGGFDSRHWHYALYQLSDEGSATVTKTFNWRENVPQRKRQDPFPHADWERRRSKVFAPKVDELVEEDLASPEGLELGRAMQDAFEEIEEELAGFKAPQLSTTAKIELKQLRRLKRMAGALGKILGVIRNLFGSAFVKAANAFDGFKEKLRKRVEKPRAAASGGGIGGWREVVVKILVAAIVEGLRLLAADITRRFAEFAKKQGG